MNEDYIPIPAYICISILSMVFAYSSLDKSSPPLQVEEPASGFTSSLPPVAETFSKIGSVLPSVGAINPFANTGNESTSSQPATAASEKPSEPVPPPAAAASEKPSEPVPPPAAAASEKPSEPVPPPAIAPQENIPIALPVRGGKRRQTKSNKQLSRRKQKHGSKRKALPKRK